VELFASADAAVDASDVLLKTGRKAMRLAPGRSTGMRLRFAYPDDIDGPRFLLARVDSVDAIAEADESNNVAASTVPVAIARPFVDLAATLPNPEPVTARRGSRIRVPVGLSNGGNVAATGRVTVSLSARPCDGGEDMLLRTRPIGSRLGPGAERLLTLRFVVPAALAPETYSLVALVDATNLVPEPDEDDNAALATEALQVL
jgi:subtilase family serine protease